MSPEHWQGDPERQTAASKWLRSRWTYGSLKVFDLDSVIVSNDYKRGILIEWKHVSSANRNWFFTRTLAEAVGFYAALFIYDTDDGTPYGTVVDPPVAFIHDPEGNRMKNGEAIDVEKFDQWVRERFGE